MQWSCNFTTHLFFVGNWSPPPLATKLSGDVVAVQLYRALRGELPPGPIDLRLPGSFHGTFNHLIPPPVVCPRSHNEGLGVRCACVLAFARVRTIQEISSPSAPQVKDSFLKKTNLLLGKGMHLPLRKLAFSVYSPSWPLILICP